MNTALLLLMQAEPAHADFSFWKVLALIQLPLLGLAAAWLISLRRRCNRQILQIKHVERSSRHAIVQSEQLAVESHRARTFFLDHLSHQLRTPLNIIFGYAELLEDELSQQNLTAPLADLRRIRDAGAGLQHMINQVIVFSRIENGKEMLCVDDFLLSQLLEEFVTLYESSLRKRGNRLLIHFNDLPARMVTDSSKIKAILGQLVQNANHFTHGGEIHVEVEPIELRNGPGVRFTVRDTGSGVATAVIPHLFEIFTTADPDCNHPGAGAGLGLAIGRAFARLLGGDLTLASTDASGSCFRLELPTQLVAATSVSPVPPVESSIANARLICLESDPAGGQQLADMLKRIGCEPLLFQEPAAALSAIAEQTPDLVIVETCMRKHGGLQFLRGLQAQLGPVPPLLLLSPLDAVGAAYMLGVLGYLFKPLEEKRLLALLALLFPNRSSQPILIVDDDRTSRAIVCKWLQRSGWAVIEAQNGIEALQLLEKQTPSLILLDLIMPQMGGFEFFHQLSSDSRNREIPVIFVTGARPTDDAKLRLGRSSSVLRYHGDYSAPDFALQLETQIRLLLSESTP